MDYRGILKIAKEKLDANFSYVIKDIENEISAVSTGGEIVMRVGKYLKDLETKEKNAYLILKEEIVKYLKDCKRNGLIII